MIRFYFHPTPNPAKVALLLEEAGLEYELVPVDTSKGEQHLPAYLAINPNGKVPAIVDTDGPGGREVRVFDSNAILLYLAEKVGNFLGDPADRAELLSWLFFVSSGLGPFSGQAVHFQRAAPSDSITPSTATGARRTAITKCWTCISPTAASSSVNITRSWTWRHGVGLTGRSSSCRAPKIPWRPIPTSNGGSPTSMRG